MNPLHDILSSIDPSKAHIFSTNPPVPRLSTSSPKPAAGAQRSLQRPTQPVNGTAEASSLKRKASSSGDLGYNKVPKKDAPAPLAPANGARSGSAPAGARSASTTPTTSMPYRGTANSGVSKAANLQVRKPVHAGSGSGVPGRAVTPATRPTIQRPTGSTSTASATPVKKVGGYLAMLQKAKEKSAAKPIAAPVKPEPVKFMSKKERDAAREAAKAAAKRKKLPAGSSKRSADAKEGANGGAQEKRKPVELGYQGTARSATKSEVTYKGTARSVAPAKNNGRPVGTQTSKLKSKSSQGNHGYRDWSDLEDEEGDEEEEDYASDGSSDMEGGMWDLAEEEAQTTRIAIKEDAAELAAETAAKRLKEERRRKLDDLRKAAAGKKKY